jgi:anion-transporting  ArsA/GET3 family ATPase
MPARVLFVTGKGGCGKTTVAAALAIGLAAAKHRVLLVELASERGFERLFDSPRLELEPQKLALRLAAARIDRRALVEAYFRRLLPLSFLSRRLLSSITFNALSSAAPGVQEFLVLEQLLRWTESRRPRWDFIVVDAPASGHALQLLRTPRQLARLLAGGPLAATLARITDLLADARHFQVVLVSTAEEMSVNETLESAAALRDDLGIAVTAPLLNRTAAARFNARDVGALRGLAQSHPHHPVLRAAALQVAAQEATAEQAERLRHGWAEAPVALPYLFTDTIERGDLDALGALAAAAVAPPSRAKRG